MWIGFGGLIRICRMWNRLIECSLGFELFVRFGVGMCLLGFDSINCPSVIIFRLPMIVFGVRFNFKPIE
jgi:hypothetical protein